MAQDSERVAKNTTYLTVALVVQKVIAFFFFLIIARRLGGVGTGLYVGAFSFSSFFGVLVDFGLASVLTRELARYPEKTNEYLRAANGLKIVLSVIAYALLMLTVALLAFFQLNHPPLEVVAVAGLIMVLDSFVLTGTSVFRGWQNLWYESVVVVVNKIAVFAFGCLALWLVPSAFSLALAILLGGVFSAGLLTHYLSKRQPQPWLPSFRLSTWRTLLVLARPFAVAGFFSTAYAHADSILLTVMKGSEAVGLYSVASKTMNAFGFIPSAFSAALYPAMSNESTNDAHLALLLQHALRYLAILSIPLAFGLYLLADEFVLRIGVEYASSAVAVRILMPSLVFMFLSYPLGALLNATNRQHWQTGIIAGATILNVGLNIVLIPMFSYVGASVAWLVTNVGMFVAGFILSRRVIAYSLRDILVTFGRTILSVLVMGIMVYFLRPYVPLIITVAFSGLTYAAVLLFTGEITPADIRQFKKLFTSRSIGSRHV